MLQKITTIQNIFTVITASLALTTANLKPEKPLNLGVNCTHTLIVPNIRNIVQEVDQVKATVLTFSTTSGNEMVDGEHRQGKG